RSAKREAACLLKHGCSLAQLGEIKKLGREMQAAGVGYARTPLGAYRSQMHNARKRGIEWKISLWEWWTIWQESGHWDDRGRGTGYMMCRFGDTGDYELGNVYIATGVHNGSVQPNNPYRKDHPDFDRAIADKN